MNEDERTTLLRGMNQLRYGHLEQRRCTKEEPMNVAEKDNYRWFHDAVKTGEFFNLDTMKCQNCGLEFSCLPLQPRQ